MIKQRRVNCNVWILIAAGHSRWIKSAINYRLFTFKQNIDELTNKINKRKIPIRLLSQVNRFSCVVKIIARLPSVNSVSTLSGIWLGLNLYWLFLFRQ